VWSKESQNLKKCSYTQSLSLGTSCSSLIFCPTSNLCRSSTGTHSIGCCSRWGSRIFGAAGGCRSRSWTKPVQDSGTLSRCAGTSIFEITRTLAHAPHVPIRVRRQAVAEYQMGDGSQRFP
jgi:hypothetical protein